VAKSHVPCVTSPRTGTFGHRKDLFPDHDSTASRVQDGLAKMPPITVTAVLIALFCADIVAAGNGGVHIYRGKDPAQWRTYAMATSSSGTLIYTGGEYPISIVKTSVDSAGNTYIRSADGSQLLHQRVLIRIARNPMFCTMCSYRRSIRPAPSNMRLI
jgi:hypothetical protein